MHSRATDAAGVAVAAAVVVAAVATALLLLPSYAAAAATSAIASFLQYVLVARAANNASLQNRNQLEICF